MYVLFDSHVHLDAPRLDAPRLSDELHDARSLGWCGAVIAGYGPGRVTRSNQICGLHDGLHRALGLHPWWLAEHAEQPDVLDAGWQQLLVGAQQERPVALGELGLDRGVVDRMPLEQQERWLSKGLALAADLGLPAILHVVGVPGRAHELLRPFARPRLGILHRYGGSAEMVPGFEALGLYLSLSPGHLRRDPGRAAAVARAISADRLLVETDWAGGEPGYGAALQAMGGLIAALAGWRSVDEAALAARLVANSQCIYGIEVQRGA